MIASRFRPVGWVAAVAIAALGCYLVSLRVATKRGEVAGVEAQILAARQDMRQLETELGTRSRLVQLERWNSQALALSAPRAGQYLTSAVQLASLGAMPEMPGAPAGTPGDGAVLQATYQPPATAAGRVQQVVVRAVAARPAPAAIVHAVSLPAAAKPAHGHVALASAIAAKPAHARVELASAAALDSRAVRAAVRAVARLDAARPARHPRVEFASADDEDAPALLRRADYVKLGGGHASVRQVALLDDGALGAIERAAREETGEGKKRR